MRPAARCRRRRFRWRPHTRGQAVVEFAIVLPVMVLLLVFAIDFGRVLFSWIEVMNAAREGEQTGCWVWHWSNRTPSAASRSRFGVAMSEP